MIGSGLMRTRMRVRSRTLTISATGQASAPVEATLVDLRGHVRTSQRSDALINRGEAGIDDIEIVIPWYPGVLVGYVVQVYDIVASQTVITNYEIVEVTDDRNKHRQLRLRCKVGERSVLPPASYSATLVTVGGGGGGGGTTNKTTTNLILQSENFVTSWNVQAAIAVTTGGIAPDNVGTAKLATVTSGTFASINQTIASGTNRTISLFVKAGSSSSCGLGAYSFATAWGNNADSTAVIVSGPGTMTQNTGSLFIVSGLSSSVWTRIAVTRSTQHDIFYIYPAGVGSSLTGSVQIWGAQAETGTTATAYVPTTTTTAIGYTPGGGGGGAGEYITSVQTFVSGTSYVVTIGTGGAGAITGTQQAASGTSSSFIGGLISQTSIGGGGGGSGQSLSYAATGGGSGGGAGGIVGGTGGTATSGNPGGAAGSPASPWRGAGGGGGVSIGVTGNAGLGSGGGGTGGFAGGGGGGSANATGGGANGGGGAGGNSSVPGGTAATANTGGGGGGAGNDNTNAGTSSAGGNGGSGVVTITYAGDPVATYTGTMTTATVGGNTTHTLTTSGTLTA